MISITAILEPDETGTVHLRLPEESLRGKIKVRVVATPLDSDEEEDEALRQKALSEITAKIHERNPFRDLTDPVAWQWRIRDDVNLP